MIRLKFLQEIHLSHRSDGTFCEQVIIADVQEGELYFKRKGIELDYFKWGKGLE